MATRKPKASSRNKKKRHGRDAAHTTNPRSTYLNPEGVLPIVNLTNAKTVSASEGGIVKELVKYMVTDDLSMTPVSMTFVADILWHYVKDLCALENRVIEFGSDEALWFLYLPGCRVVEEFFDAALSNAFLVKKDIKRMLNCLI
ncbi:hypothetical protein Q3G72_024993 [Acer saccharum]|nr:hypothetical protein Q3G72_024993 [Acer saccharum]